MGCNVQKTKSQSNKLIQYPLKVQQNAIINHNNQGQINGQKSDIKEIDNFIVQQPQIGRRLKHMVSADELQKFINKKQNIPISPFGYIKNSPKQIKKQSLMNSPKI
ncbi:unnamed protein product [Paramecium pentaurelia]|uniref:Uncharacterized protein n=1 Tax=Paramecium pentaurelia TaxID=43138 RepID=A0A8S1V5U4_9CILI|nr:unnamed protein product [Paramecium pentaurelia]